jgi:hypothetical protein
MLHPLCCIAVGVTASTRSPTALSPSASPGFFQQPRSSGGLLSSMGSTLLDEEDNGADRAKGGRANQQVEPRVSAPAPRSGTTLDDLARRLAQVQLMGRAEGETVPLPTSNSQP